MMSNELYVVNTAVKSAVHQRLKKNVAQLKGKLAIPTVESIAHSYKNCNIMDQATVVRLKKHIDVKQLALVIKNHEDYLNAFLHSEMSFVAVVIMQSYHAAINDIICAVGKIFFRMDQTTLLQKFVNSLEEITLKINQSSEQSTALATTNIGTVIGNVLCADY